MAAQYGFEVDDLDAFYYMTEVQTYVWAYAEDGRLIGENILEDPSTRQFWKRAPEDVITEEEAFAILNPMLDEALASSKLR